jgi:hypothetical protein
LSIKINNRINSGRIFSHLTVGGKGDRKDGNGRKQALVVYVKQRHSSGRAWVKPLLAQFSPVFLIWPYYYLHIDLLTLPTLILIFVLLCLQPSYFILFEK